MYRSAYRNTSRVDMYRAAYRIPYQNAVPQNALFYVHMYACNVPYAYIHVCTVRIIYYTGIIYYKPNDMIN